MGTSTSSAEPVDVADTEVMEYNAKWLHLTGNINPLQPRKRLTACEEKAKQDLIEKVAVIPTNMDQTTERWILKILQEHYLFCSLSDDDLIQVIRKMVKCTANAEEYIFRMGERPGAFFIIEKGNVDIEGRGGYKKANLTRDDSFGELGLLYNANRSASIKTKVDCEFWCLTKNNFKLVEKEIVKQNYKQSIKHVNELQLFQFMTEYQKNSIACSMFTLRYPKDSIIFKKNDQANSFFIVKNGEVMLKSQDMQMLVKQYSYFGDECFQHTRKPLRLTSAEAVTTVECLSVSREAIKSIMGDNVKELINYNILKSALIKSQFFSKLDPINLQKLIHLSKLKHMKNDEVIFQADRQPNKIVVILYGSGFNQKIGTLLGEDFMLLDRKPAIVVRKQGDGEVAEISYQRIIKMLKQTSIQSLRKRKYNTIQEASEQEDEHTVKTQYLQLKNESRFQELTVIKILDEEQQFSKVILAENKNTNALFSIRMILKSQFDHERDYKIIGSLIQQRAILEQIRHPFLMKMIKKHKDENFLYLVSEYDWSYSLFLVLRQIGLLNKTITKFYMAILILALEYLHSKQIVLRDLKPENVMLYHDGYLKINDFTSAKKLNKDIGYRTFTQIGTPHYMAPEVILGKGYSFAVDLWSAGVMFYEFVIGKVPFGQDEDDPFKIQQTVLNRGITYPNEYQDENGKQIIEQLLNKSPELRLSKGYNNLKAHAFFNTINWKKLQKKQQAVPFKSKKFYFGQILSLDIKLNDFIKQQKDKIPHSKKGLLTDWDQEF